VSVDFDGNEVGAHGLHAFFETQTVNEIPDQELLASVGEAAKGIVTKIPDDIPPLDAAFILAQNGRMQAKVLLSDAKQLGLTPALAAKSKPIIVNTLAMSTAVLAKIWNEAYILAGAPSFSTENLGRIPIPNYLRIDYLKGKTD